jgi:hypothetical protein
MNNKNGLNKKISSLLISLLIILGTFAYVGLTNSHLFLIILNALWLILLLVVILFVFLGILTVIGLKKEAGKIIDLILEGSITIIEVIDFIKSLIEAFKQTIISAIIIFIPYASYFLAAFTYFFVLIFYKWIGAFYDVTILTIVITLVLTVIAGILNLPKDPRTAKQTLVWGAEAIQKFKRNFSDAFEIAIFVLFLTIDSTNLIFLPKELRVNLKATVGEYDLMTRSFVFTDHLRITITLIIIGIGIELLRNIIRLITAAVMHYREAHSQGASAKTSIRHTVTEAKDDFLMFSAFTTIMMVVFLVFPRLKLVALVTASLSNLILDVILPQRLTMQKREDLIARVFTKLFRLDQ